MMTARRRQAHSAKRTASREQHDRHDSNDGNKRHSETKRRKRKSRGARTAGAALFEGVALRPSVEMDGGGYLWTDLWTERVECSPDRPIGRRQQQHRRGGGAGRRKGQAGAANKNRQVPRECGGL